jgi:hypothetical protein
LLLTNRRIALLHLLLAGMTAAWLTPFLTLVWPAGLSPWAGFAALLGGLLAWMLFMELLSRRFESPQYDVLALGALLVVGLVLVRVVLFPGGPPWSLAWVGRAIDTMSDVGGAERGLPRAITLLVVNLVLWQRASAATSRDLHFFGVGLSFRIGLLLVVLGGGLAGALRGTAPLSMFWLYLALGLSAVAVSRVSQKAIGAQSTGRILPAGRVAQTLLAVGAAVGASWLLSLAYTQDTLIRFLRLFAPVWRILRPVLLAAILFLARLLEPLLVWVEALAERLMAGNPIMTQDQGPIIGAAPDPSQGDALGRLQLDTLRDILIIVFAVLAVALLVGFLLVYLERVRRGGVRGEGEEEGQEPASFGGGILGRTVGALRRAGGMVRRFGVGRDLLAAISVQNIYANLCRLARERGAPRPPSQPPDAYLPTLLRVFPGGEEQLGRITAAYMRVHYGDHPVRAEELAALREDYRVLREGDRPPNGD